MFPVIYGEFGSDMKDERDLRVRTNVVLHVRHMTMVLHCGVYSYLTRCSRRVILPAVAERHCGVHEQRGRRR